MPQTLHGSCHCGAIEYTVASNTPCPYQLCQCGICRKVGGYMGSVNIMGNAESLQILKGNDKLKAYHAVKYSTDGQPQGRLNSERKFCSECSSMLWLYDSTYPDWIYPFASSIDSPLPCVARKEHAQGGNQEEETSPTLLAIMRECAPEHVPLPEGCVFYPTYPPGEGIEAWHKKHGLWVD